MKGYTDDGTGLILSETELLALQSWAAEAIPAEFTIFERLTHPATPGPISGLDFGEALRHMREGKWVRRDHNKGGWGEKRYWWYMNEGQLCFSHRGLKALNSSITASDILATDWAVLPSGSWGSAQQATDGGGSCINARR